MDTQNVSIKVATRRSSERWGSDPKARLDCVIAEQRLYLAQLCQVWNPQLNRKGEAEGVLRLLSLMSGNIHKEGVLYWERSYPPASFYVIQPWSQARDHAVRLYGATECEAQEVARKDLCNNVNSFQVMICLGECQSASLTATGYVAINKRRGAPYIYT